jgi:predicted ATP-grasp superfamily ATP-dependent carboligase
MIRDVDSEFFKETIESNNKILEEKQERREKELEAVRLAKEKAETEKKIAEIAKTSSTGGYKKVKDKYTVKELKAIASRNNIKITKKLNGKTVPLNKKGLFAKLKRNKVI